MTITVRTATLDDREAIFRLRARAFTQDPGADFDYDDSTSLPDDRRLVAEVAGTVVGHLGVWDMGQWFGGRRVPCGGVASVAVDPAWRGAGAAKLLLREALEQMRARGEVLSTLFPMTRGLYRRFGWEIAGEWPRALIDASALAGLPRPDAEVTVREITADDVAAQAAVYDVVARTENGMLARPQIFERRMLGPDKDHLGYLAERDGQATGYLWYSHTATSEPSASYRVRVHEVVAADAPTSLRLWRIVAGTGSMSPTVEAVVSPNDPLETLLPERAVEPHPMAWRWASRLVDPAAAVAARGFPSGLRAVVPLEVADPVWPDRGGRVTLEVEGGQGQLSDGSPSGDAVRLDVGAFASVYTGWASPHGLARLGRISGPTGHLDDLAAAFHGPTPWVRNFF